MFSAGFFYLAQCCCRLTYLHDYFKVFKHYFYFGFAWVRRKFANSFANRGLPRQDCCTWALFTFKEKSGDCFISRCWSQFPQLNPSRQDKQISLLSCLFPNSVYTAAQMCWLPEDSQKKARKSPTKAWQLPDRGQTPWSKTTPNNRPTNDCQ